MIRRGRAVGLSAVVLAVIAACAACGTHPAAGGGSAVIPLTPRQALLATAAQEKKVTSAAETLTIQYSGLRSGTTTGIIEFRRTRTLELSENLTTTVAGKTVQIRVILTGTAVYIKLASLAKQIGKPWLRLDLSAMNRTPLASLAQLINSVQSNNFFNQTELFAAVKKIRIIGKQTVNGVPTTEYAGSFAAPELSRALAPALRKVLAPALQVLGNSTVSFHIWIDGQHHPRRTNEVETINGLTVNTTVNVTAINQPVQITPPPASQTFTPPGG